MPADATLLKPAPAHLVDLDDPLLAVGTVDSDWRIDRMSNDIEQLLGYPAESIIGVSIMPVVHPSDRPALQVAVGEAAEGTGGVSIRLRLKDMRQADDSGGWRLCRAVISPSSGQDPPA
ncbi:MAG: PAS domain-containing protein, partial [Actinomycetota bacterium]|nr:PAS domain-containing protein [Actinomycetota bacterium]